MNLLSNRVVPFPTQPTRLVLLYSFRLTRRFALRFPCAIQSANTSVIGNPSFDWALGQRQVLYRTFKAIKRPSLR